GGSTDTDTDGVDTDTTDGAVDTGATGGTDGGTTDTGATGGTTTGAAVGYIGSPCGSDADCPYDGGVCLKESEGFPRGTCSASCDQFCDDADGYPTTFCAEVGALPSAVSYLGDGGCLSRCDFATFPGVGCREDYGCVPTGRANDPGVETYACLPNVASDLSSCMADLAGRGVPFEPTIVADDVPVGGSETCHVEEPILFHSGYLGVDLVYSTTSPDSVLGACSLGQSLADTIEDVVPQGVTTIHHLGTYNCRVIAGTATLSRHGFGDAIDLSSFEFSDGTEYVVEFDWEIDDASPETAGGQWLYDAAHGWHDQGLWNIILTPDYNSAHYNHFHIDMTPGSDFLGRFALPGGEFSGGRYIGPSPWGDE
ncbi:MAG: extensin family protein, partial [Myxococcota bacterium]